MDEEEAASQTPVHQRRWRRFARNGMIGLISGLVFALVSWVALAAARGSAVDEYLRSGYRAVVYPCLLIGDYLTDLGLIKGENMPATIAMILAYFGIIGLTLGLGITCFTTRAGRTKHTHI